MLFFLHSLRTARVSEWTPRILAGAGLRVTADDHVHTYILGPDMLAHIHRSCMYEPRGRHIYIARKDRRELANMAATAAFLAIPELLENALLSVDEHTLLLANRVCKMFHSAIRNSLHIRRKLFLERCPIPSGTPSTRY